MTRPMIRLGQHRRIPRERLIGEEGLAWMVQAAHGAGWLLFMIAAVALPQHLPQILAWARELHIAIVADGRTTFLN